MLHRLLITLFILLFVSTGSYSQNIYVPYRVGDKFGLANESGEIIVEPAYDNIRLCSTSGYFTGYKKTDENTFTSSLIYKDKVILEDQKYFSINSYDGIIIGQFLENTEVGPNRWKKLERSDVYNNEGKRILPDSYESTCIHSRLDPERKTNELLISVYPSYNKFSLFIFDINLNVIKKQLLDQIDAPYINFPFLEENSKLIISTHSEKLKGMVYVISPTEKGYELTVEDYSAHSWSGAGSGTGTSDGKPKSHRTNSSDVIKKIYRSRQSTAPERRDRIMFDTSTLESTNYSLMKSGTKIGIKRRNPNLSYIEVLPCKYDDLYMITYDSYLKFPTIIATRIGEKYGLFIGSENKVSPTIVDPIYSIIPYIEKLDYFRVGSHLIGIYDEKGVFHHFANMDGKEYYREN